MYVDISRPTRGSKFAKASSAATPSTLRRKKIDTCFQYVEVVGPWVWWYYWGPSTLWCGVAVEANCLQLWWTRIRYIAMEQ